MLKKILAIVTMLYAATSFAAVDVNKASSTDLDSIKGIGPAISSKILDERKKGNFKDWNDFIERVKGIGEANGAKFSAEGLTVNGASFKGAAPAAAPVAKAAAPAAAKATPAAAAPAAKPVAAAAPVVKEEVKDPKAAAKQAKAEEAKAKREADKQAKADKKKAKADAAASAADAKK